MAVTVAKPTIFLFSFTKLYSYPIIIIYNNHEYWLVSFSVLNLIYSLSNRTFYFFSLLIDAIHIWRITIFFKTTNQLGSLWFFELTQISTHKCIRLFHIFFRRFITQSYSNVNNTILCESTTEHFFNRFFYCPIVFLNFFSNICNSF